MIVLLLSGWSVQSVAAGFSDPPRSIGPNKNIIEWMGRDPSATFPVKAGPELEKCLTIALSFGLGGAPVIIHEPDRTTIYSLLPRTFGLVSTMLIVRADGVLEYRGTQAFELRLVKQCLAG